MSYKSFPTMMIYIDELEDLLCQAIPFIEGKNVNLSDAQILLRRIRKAIVETKTKGK